MTRLNVVFGALGGCAVAIAACLFDETRMKEAGMHHERLAEWLMAFGLIVFVFAMAAKFRRDT